MIDWWASSNRAYDLYCLLIVVLGCLRIFVFDLNVVADCQTIGKAPAVVPSSSLSLTVLMEVASHEVRILMTMVRGSASIAFVSR